MTSDSQFNAIRPYIGEEIPAAVERLSQAEEFLTLFSQMTRHHEQRAISSSILWPDDSTVDRWNDQRSYCHRIGIHRERQELPFRIQPPGHHFGLGHTERATV